MSMPALKRVREEDVPDQGVAGLSDGGHVILKCSNCGAALMDLWRTRPHENHTSKVQANCPFCGDKSFVVDVKGGFHAAGYGRPHPEDEDEVIPSTEYTHFDIVDEVCVFRVIKANENAQPVRA